MYICAKIETQICEVNRMFVVTSNQMYQAECNAVKRGFTFPQLMENAGQACAAIIKKHFCISKQNPRNVLILCGKGKNGGDGFVIARRMWEYGCDVTVLLACGEPKAQDSVEMFSLVEAAGINVVRYDNNLTLLKPYFDNADIIVEAIFGTGFTGSLNHSLSVLAQAANAAEARIVSIDVPAGADCDTATVQGTVFKADMTIAISARVRIDDNNLDAVCTMCGSRYDVVAAGGAPVDGPALTGEVKYRLQPYRCIPASMGGYIITR